MKSKATNNNVIKKQDFRIETANELFYQSMLCDPEDLDAIYKAQLKSIEYSEKYAIKGNNDAKRFIIALAQGKEGSLGELSLPQIKRDAFNSIQRFFGAYVKSLCVNRFTASNPNASFDEMKEDVNGAVSSAWIEITKDFSSYDPEKGEFSTWACGRIIGGIQNYIANERGRKSKTTLQIDKKVFNIVEDFKNEGVLYPSASLVAQKLNMSVETVKNSLLRMENENKMLSIESLYTKNEHDEYTELNIGETMMPISEDLFSPEKKALINENRQILLSAVKSLSENERTVLTYYQNINFDDEEISTNGNDHEISSSEIAEIMDIPENKVINLYSNALKKMKNYIEKENGEYYHSENNNEDSFLSKRTMTFSESKEDDDLFIIIDSIEDVYD